MTRETKIGLLVGLAFIIVIGILLSDHLSSSTEPPPATLANAGSNVMQTVNTPGGANVPPVTSPGAAPQQVTPNQQVPTTADLTPRPQPVQIVQVGPGAGAQAQPNGATISVQSHTPSLSPSHPTSVAPPPVITMHQPQQSEPAPVAQAQDEDSPIITQVPQANVETSLASAAQQNGEQLVGLDASGRPTQNPGAISWTQALTGGREHKAEPGDSVSRWASRFMGANTKTNRDLIVRANPSLQADPNKVIVGKTYVIPALAEGAAPAVASASPDQTQMQVQPEMQLMPQPGTTVAVALSSTEYVYTVRERDSLWKIANEQLGNPGAVAAIKELNKDALKGGDTVFVGMKLKLPGKPLAQATN